MLGFRFGFSRSLLGSLVCMIDESLLSFSHFGFFMGMLGIFEFFLLLKLLTGKFLGCHLSNLISNGFFSCLLSKSLSSKLFSSCFLKCQFGQLLSLFFLSLFLSQFDCLLFCSFLSCSLFFLLLMKEILLFLL